jgi:hypothetical protein
VITPAAYLASIGMSAYTCQDHHLTGPLYTQFTPDGETSAAIFTEEGRILSALAAKYGGPVLEIGADFGVSARFIHEGLDHHGGRDDIIDSIDIRHPWPIDDDWPRRTPLILNTLSRFALPCLQQRAAANGADYRWAFIDGDHMYAAVLSDIILCKALKIPLLVFHDAHDRLPVPENNAEAGLAVADYLGKNPAWTVQVISTHSGLAVAQRNDS